MTTNLVHLAPRPVDPDRLDGPPAPVLAMRERAVYTVKEVAQLLSLSLGSTYALIRSGQIPAIKMGGRWIVPKKRFHAWLDSCIEPPDPHPAPWDRPPFGNPRGGA